ncbi:hypothetical protein [Psychrobacter sp. I-STPA10]|uniref:hypothetical protein n=1 Tax=Psychrobacter sp. I-STPA10 TaxID=2585769 RepID=UPI001E3BB601|nr:hypothetical protein [Psychrobacter sp. I-STPA10]
MSTKLSININADGITLTSEPNNSALANIIMNTQYGFDENVVAKVSVTDDKSPTPSDDPLNNLVFSIIFADKVDDSVITHLQGRLYTEGGIEALEQNYPNDFGYITRKLDFTGALDGENDFFETVETKYSATNAEAIKTAINTAKALNVLGAYRKKEVVLAVPATEVEDVEPIVAKRSLLDMAERPRYIVCNEVGNLPMIEAMVEVMDKLNIHLLIDIGNLTDWTQATALAESISVQDHRVWLFWNPNKSRPSNATTVLARKKWRPCTGDYLGQLLLRNSQTNNSGIPPLNRPIAGYDFPVGFRDIERLPEVNLDEEAQNALAKAGINVVMNERFDAGSRWVYGDALTQYDSKTSALRLINSAEITTFTDNTIVGIVKKHLLKGMSSFVKDATTECNRFLDACVAAGLLMPATDLGGRYYSLIITPRADNPFEKADVKLARRPEGCARQVFFETTVTK